MLYTYLTEHARYMNIIGIITVLIIAFLFSEQRHAIDVRLIITGLLLQFFGACALLKTSGGYLILDKIAQVIAALYGAADAGISFVFGSLADASTPWGFIFAIKVLPLIIFFAAGMSLLYYFGIIQRIVLLINYAVQPLLRTTGPETVCAIANSFLGQTEAPLVVRHYLARMTRSQLFVVMVSGMGTISAAILAVYAAMGVPAQHLLTASVLAIPATIVMAKIICPETHERDNEEYLVIDTPQGNMFDAIAQGTSEGLHLALNIGAMLIAFLSLIALINMAIAPWSLSKILGYICSPIGILMGFSYHDALIAGELIGIKIALNEMVAFTQLVTLSLPPRAVAILTYALCSFSNFSSIGIQLAGIGILVPSQRSTLSSLSVYAVCASTLANLLSAFMVGLLL